MLVYEIEHLTVGKESSLQGFSTVAAEALFGRARFHAKTHQTMTGILEDMSMSQALRLFHANQMDKKRKFEYREIVQFRPEPEDGQCDDRNFMLQAEALLDLVGFLISNYRALRKRHEPSGEILALVESRVLPFIPDPETHRER
jgi:hypothetical protein